MNDVDYVAINSRKTSIESRLLEFINQSKSEDNEDYDKECDNGKINFATWPLFRPPTYETKSEASLLDEFNIRFKDRRSFFTASSKDRDIRNVFHSLLQKCFLNCNWMENAPVENAALLMTSLRILLRDSTFVGSFHRSKCVPPLCRYLELAIQVHFADQHDANDRQLFFVEQILVEMTNIMQKLSVKESLCKLLIEESAHQSLVLLLSSACGSILHSSLQVLNRFAQRPTLLPKICELQLVNRLLVILLNYDETAKSFSASLLKFLSASKTTQEEILALNALPRLLSLIHSNDLKMVCDLVWCLVQLASHRSIRENFYEVGGVLVLLSLLAQSSSSGHYRSDLTTSSSPLFSPTFGKSEPDVSVVSLEESSDACYGVQLSGAACDAETSLRISVQSVVCAAITELTIEDVNSVQVVEHNGIYLIAKLLLPCSPSSDHQSHQKAMVNRQLNATRALRFLFSMERNRPPFKTIFSTLLLECFIDIGHYRREVESYQKFVDIVNSLQEQELADMHQRLETVNHVKSVLHYVRDYAVLAHLGSGAFGTVYKVKKVEGSTMYAMKEIRMVQTSLKPDQCVSDLMNELSIVKSKLMHPNVVRYHRFFVEKDKLYIVMQLIEGASLKEHINSLKDKGQRFTEARLWHLATQLVQALKYLHKEKKIVHRDLTPNNIMLGHDDKLTLTDFGLAKLRKTDTSKMESMVGTMLYSCPEIVKSEPYTEKADIWAFGCVLYEMCCLEPAFKGTSMLSIIKQIADVSYAPLPANHGYSDKLVGCISSCLVSCTSSRPDVIKLASMMAEELIFQLDKLQAAHRDLQERFNREKQRVPLTSDGMGSEPRRNVTGSQDNLSGSSASSDLSMCSSSMISQLDDVAIEEPVSRLERAISMPSASRGERSRLGSYPSIPRTGLNSPGERVGSAGSIRSLPRKDSSNKHALTVSQRKVREIDDPVLQMLNILHKIIFIQQLPPTVYLSWKRRIIERYKRQLFAPRSSAFQLKQELSKFLHFRDEYPLASQDPLHESIFDEQGQPIELTYEKLNEFIEDVLAENEYYCHGSG